MRKSGAKIKHRAKAPPGLIVQSIAKDYELRLRTSVNAFRLGYAQAAHFNDLADCVDILQIAESSTTFAKKDDGAIAACELAKVALDNIRARYEKHGRFGVAGDETRALELLAETSLSYWNRKSGALYHYAYTQLKSVRQKQADAIKQGEAA